MTNHKTKTTDYPSNLIGICCADARWQHQATNQQFLYTLFFQTAGLSRIIQFIIMEKVFFKSMLDSFGVVAFGAFARRSVATVEDTNLAVIKDDEVYAHFKELTTVYLETLGYATLMQLSTESKRLRAERKSLFTKTYSYLEGLLDAPAEETALAAQAVVEALGENDKRIIKKPLPDQVIAFDNVCAILQDATLAENLTTLKLTERVAKLVETHELYEKKYRELGDFHATHKVSSKLKQEILRTAKDFIDMVQAKASHTTNQELIDLYNMLIYRVKEVNRSKKKIKSALDEIEELNDEESATPESKPSGPETPEGSAE